MRTIFKRKLLVGVIAVLVMIAGGGYLYARALASRQTYRTMTVTRGPLVSAVSATGTLNAVITVVSSSHVELRSLAVEAAEGTDAMLRRVSLLRRRGAIGRVLRHGRPPIGERRGGVLVKAPKPTQDFRIDLPAIGPRTVRNAAAAGLAGIAVEAGGVLIVERKATLAEAERLGLFLAGYRR